MRLAPAAETLESLIENGAAGSYDFAFIDADKENYGVYYERALDLLRTGGLLVIDNVLWGGRVADEQVSDAATDAIRAFNKKIHQDRRVSLSMIPVADGLTLAVKN